MSKSIIIGFFLFMSIKCSAIQDTLYILVNPNHCVGSYPTYKFLHEELALNHNKHMIFLMHGVRKKHLIAALEESFGQVSDSVEIFINDSLYFNLAKSYNSGIYDQNEGKFFVGFDSYFTHFYLNHDSLPDTTVVHNSDHLYVPKIIAYHNDSYYCLDSKNSFLLNISRSGHIANQIDLKDILNQVRLMIGSITPEYYLEKNQMQLIQDGKKVLPDPNGYNNLVHVKVRNEITSNSTIIILIRAFEIDTLERTETKVLVDQFPLRNFEALLEFDLDFKILNATRLPSLEQNRQYNVNSFYDKQDSLLILPIFPYSETETTETPAVVQLRYSRGNQLLIDKYYDNALSKFSISSGWYHFFFNPIFIEIAGSIYYIDPAEMCFYKLGDSNYRWCIPDIPTSTIEEILSTLKVKTPIDDFKVVDDTLHMWITIFDQPNSNQLTLHKFIFDLSQSKVLKREVLFEDKPFMTSGYRFFDNTYHNLLIDDDDSMKIIRRN